MIASQDIRAKYLYRVIDRRVGHESLPLLSVSIHRGVVPREGFTDRPHRADELTNYKVCHPGDIVLNRMRAFQGAVGISPIRGIVSPDYLVVRPIEQIEGRFLHHVFRSSWFVGEMVSRLRGIGGTETGSVRTPRINAEDLGDIVVPVPSQNQQRRIADFLDTEAARINALSDSYRNLGLLMAERTRTELDAKFGDIPHSTKLSYVVRFREGPGIMAADFRDTGIPLVRVSGLRAGRVTLQGCNYVEEDEAATRWRKFRLKMGDFLISGSATMGEVSVVKDETVVGSIPYTGLIILRPGDSRTNMKFVAAFLRSSVFMNQIDLIKTGATMQHFGPSHLSQISIPFPPSLQQHAIAQFAEMERERDLAFQASIDVTNQVG